MSATIYFIVPRGPGGAETTFDLNEAKRRADKIDALVRENGLKGPVVHGAGGRVNVAKETPEQKAERERVIAEMRAEYDAQASEREANEAAWTKRMEQRSRKIED